MAAANKRNIYAPPEEICSALGKDAYFDAAAHSFSLWKTSAGTILVPDQNRCQRIPEKFL
jgi:hypothetical protein